MKYYDTSEAASYYQPGATFRPLGKEATVSTRPEGGRAIGTTVDIEAIENPLNRELARIMIHGRMERGWSQDMLADFAGIARTSVQSTERGYSTPRFENVEAILGALGYEIKFERVEGGNR